eukprot:gene6540-7214_t
MLFHSLLVVVLLATISLPLLQAKVFSHSCPLASPREDLTSRYLPSHPRRLCLSSSDSTQLIMSLRGGESNNNSLSNAEPAVPSENEKKAPYSLRRSIMKNLLGVWGVVQVVSILGNALKRLIPVAIEPLQKNDLVPFQWGLYAVWAIYMVYAEGYKAFQKKFSPMVVQRAFALIDHPHPLNILLAGPYCMGMFAASKKRMIVSWAVTAGVFSLVKIVKLLPYPYRAIVDGGVVLGLSWGALSMVALTAKALLGGKVEDKEE